MSVPDLPLLLGAVVLIGSMSGLAIVSRLWPPARGGTSIHRAGARSAAASFRPVPDGTVWRPCATTHCAHLTTAHIPAADGGRECGDCGHRTLPPYDEGAAADA